MTEQNVSTESWDGLLSRYLKADNLTQDTEKFVCTEANIDNIDGDKKLVLDLERNKGEDKFQFTCNKTNMRFLLNKGISKPKEVIGKKIALTKVKATNPQTKREVDSLRITAVT